MVKVPTSFVYFMRLRGVRIVFRPDPYEFVQMMCTQNRRIPSEIIEIVHDDGYEQVQHLDNTDGDGFVVYTSK